MKVRQQEKEKDKLEKRAKHSDLVRAKMCMKAKERKWVGQRLR